MTDPQESSRAGRFGFDWGPASVTRMAHIDGRGYVIEVKGAKGYDGPSVQILVSEKGNALTVYRRNGAKDKTGAVS